MQPSSVRWPAAAVALTCVLAVMTLVAGGLAISAASRLRQGRTELSHARTELAAARARVADLERQLDDGRGLFGLDGLLGGILGGDDGLADLGGLLNDLLGGLLEDREGNPDRGRSNHLGDLFDRLSPLLDP